MSFIEYCNESEKQNGCMGPEWLQVYRLLTLVITWLTGSAAQHHQRVLYHISLVREKLKIPNSEYGFYWMHIDFAPL